MNFMTTGALIEGAKAIRPLRPKHRPNDLPQQAYAFLSVRDLRGIVAGMVD